MHPSAVMRARQLAGQRAAARRPKSKFVSLTAPIGGVNSRDAISAMAPTDAVEMVNWYPTMGSVDLRNGYTQFCTGVGAGDVNTLAEFHAGATRKFLATSSTNIYEISTGTASSLASGFTSGRWQHVNFISSMLLVNGADTPQTYDGSTISAWTGSGPTVTNVIGCAVYRNRIYVWENARQSVWYSATNTIGGGYTEFPLGRVGAFGGNIVAVGTWTHDGGDGADDFIVFFMSSGEAMVYSGDPASTFALVGIYRVPPPINARSVVKAGPDLVVHSKDDIYSFSAVLKDGGAIRQASKISGLAKSAYATYGTLNGWQAVFFPSGGKMLFNVPLSSTLFDQFVLNINTGAWTTFSDWNARCFGVYNDRLYMGGGGGIVYQADTGDDDNGSAISADCRQAWTTFGANGPFAVRGTRPVMQTLGTLSFSQGVGYDFTPSYSSQTTSTASSGTPWGSPWGSPWSPATQIRRYFQAQTGRGYQASFRLTTQTTNQSINWYQTDFLIEPTTGKV